MLDLGITFVFGKIMGLSNAKEYAERNDNNC